MAFDAVYATKNSLMLQVLSTFSVMFVDQSCCEAPLPALDSDQYINRRFVSDPVETQMSDWIAVVMSSSRV